MGGTWFDIPLGAVLCYESNVGPLPGKGKSSVEVSRLSNVRHAYLLSNAQSKMVKQRRDDDS